MHTLIITKALQMISFNEIREFISEIYYKQVGFSKENNYYSMKRLKKKIYCCLQTN